MGWVGFRPRGREAKKLGGLFSFATSDSLGCAGFSACTCPNELDLPPLALVRDGRRWAGRAPSVPTRRIVSGENTLSDRNFWFSCRGGNLGSSLVKVTLVLLVLFYELWPR